uniref:Uncharacterized protein n=1 Tax=Romanomermis culicivorax TaxID=13658 RepID=A0A915IYB0_ROMCU
MKRCKQHAKQRHHSCEGAKTASCTRSATAGVSTQLKVTLKKHMQATATQDTTLMPLPQQLPPAEDSRHTWAQSRGTDLAASHDQRCTQHDSYQQDDRHRCEKDHHGSCYTKPMAHTFEKNRNIVHILEMSPKNCAGYRDSGCLEQDQHFPLFSHIGKINKTGWFI